MVAGKNDYYGITGNTDGSASYDSGDLVTSVIGGLNTESNPMDMPLGDTPDMLNTQISPAGTLTKRPGTIIRDNLYDNTSAASKGNGLVGVSILNGHTVIVGKLGRNLVCIPVPKHEKMGRSNLTYPRLSISNVWTADATLKPSLVTLSTSIPRVLIATGLNTMVECILYSKTVTLATASSSVSIDDKPFMEIPTMLLLDAGRSNSTSVENILFIPNYITDEENWVVYRANTKSTTSNTVTFSSGFRSIASSGSYSDLPAGSYTVLRFGWVMWTESEFIESSMTTQPVLYPSGTTSILIPEELTRNAAEDRRASTFIPSWVFDHWKQKFGCFLLDKNYNSDGDDANYWMTPLNPMPVGDPSTWNSSLYGSNCKVYITVDVPPTSDFMTQTSTDKRFSIGDTYLVPVDKGTGATTSYYITRSYRNWLNSGNGLNGDNVRCTFGNYTNDEVKVILETGYDSASLDYKSAAYRIQTGPPGYMTDWATEPKYLASQDAVWAAKISDTTTPIIYFCFRGAKPIGIPPGYVSLSNYSAFVTNTFIGTEDTTDDAGTGGTGYTDHGKVRFRDASKVPVGGLYEFSTFDTSNRDFGRIVTYFQNRVVLSGFTKYPNLVAFSNSGYDYEWDIGGNLLAPHRNFQTWYSDSSLAFNPIQVELNTGSGEFITALLPVESYLLVFTNRSVHLVSGDASAGGYITPTGYTVSKLLDVGTFNQNTVVNTESGVVFLSNSGLNILVPAEDTSGRYSSIPLSSKVQRIFNEMSLDSTSNHWITIDKDQKVYVGICTQGSYVATRLLVFDLRLQAWTEYGAANGYWFSTMGFTLSDNSRVFTDFITCTNLLLGTAGSNHLLVEFSKYAELDFIISNTGSTSYSSYSPIPSFIASLPYNASQQFYNYDLKTVNSTNVLRTIDIPDVVDYYTYVDSPNKKAYPIDPRTGLYPIYADVDHVWTDWNSGITGINAAAKVLIGSGFPVWLKSSVVTRAFSGRGKHDNKSKRYSHCILHFRNSDNTQYIYSDLNTGASQAASTIVDKYKTVYDANLSLIFNGSRSSTQYLVYQNTTNVDTYGSLTLPKIRRDLTSRVVLPFLGISNSTQVCVFCNGYHKFELTGFQLITRSVGDSRRSWQDLY